MIPLALMASESIGHEAFGLMHGLLTQGPFGILGIIVKYTYCFRIPFIDKWYPFHMSSLELCFPFNCHKCTVF